MTEKLTAGELDDIVRHCSVQNFRPVRHLIYRAIVELRDVYDENRYVWNCLDQEIERRCQAESEIERLRA